MKIRKSFGLENDRKVFIHENKKEETVLVAIPSLNWSVEFTYEDMGDELLCTMNKTLANQTSDYEAKELAQRINQWTKEM